MASNVNDRYKAGLTCALCQDILTDPRTLPCLHSYCHKCLHSLIEESSQQGGSFNCPECRQVYDIPQQEVGHFKVSPTITFLLDAYKDSNQTQEPECLTCLDTHEKHTPATIHCLDCNKKLCASCHKMHGIFTQDHKVVNLTGESAKDLQTAFQMVKERTVYCKQHPKKPVEYYCKADKTVLCQSCFTINHSGHPCEDVNETAARNMKPIGAVVTQGKQLVDMYEQGIQDIQTYKSGLECRTENVLAEINNDMNALKEVVDAKYKSLKDQVLKEKQNNVKQVMSHLGHLELNKAIIEGQVNKYCTMMEHGHPVEIADLAEQVAQKAEEWTKQPKIDFDAKIDMELQTGTCSDAGVRFGNILVTNVNTAKKPEIRKLKPLCELSVEKVKLHNEYIWGLLGTPDGQYVVAGGISSSAAIYDKDYKLVKDLGEKYESVVRTTTGELAFTNQTNTITILKEDGTHSHNIVCKDLEQLQSITMNLSGEYVVCDNKLKAVYCVDASTGETKQLSKTGMFKGPIFVAYNSKGVTIISDYEGNFVKGIDKDGNEVFSYGESGDGEGELNGSRGVCTDDEDNIFVADIFNHRVHMMDPQGRFMRYVLTEKDEVYEPNAVTIDNDGNLLVGDMNGSLFIVKYRG